MEKKIKKKELKLLRDIQIEILDEIVRICKKHNLRYFLSGGTLLGAVRHGGFIPWDDDLDIGMPRKDYEKFIFIAKKELNKKYYLQDIDTDKNYWQGFAKVRKNNTLFDEQSIENINTHKGIFVDVFPYDDSKKIDFIFKIKWSIIKNFQNFCLYYRGIYDKTQVNHYFCCKICSVVGMNRLLKLSRFILKTHFFKGGKYFLTFVGAYPMEKEILEFNWIFPTKKIKFENKMYDCPNNPDAVLTRLYGNYMKLPPVDQRVTHLPKKILFDLEEDGK